MIVNVGSTDKVVRIVLGLVLLSFFFFLEGPARWIGILGIVALLTAFLGFCPLYTLLGVNTCPKK